jgi:hypothetical protein
VVAPAIYQASPSPPLAYVDLGVIDSTPGEAKADYMLRVATVLDQFTTVSGHEACGVIMQRTDDSGWRVRLTTNRSQLGCVRMLFDEPGYVFTDETIHSHPNPRWSSSLHANAQDSRLRGFGCGDRILVHDEDFSPGDLANGPGYLVAEGVLLHQRDGVRTHLGGVPRAPQVTGLVSLPNPTGRMSSFSNPSARATVALANTDAAAVTPVGVSSSPVEASPTVPMDPAAAALHAAQAWQPADRPGLPVVSCKAWMKRS